MHIGEVFLHDTVCMKAIHSCSTARPHVVHQLSGDAVDKLCVSFLLQRGNDPRMQETVLLRQTFGPVQSDINDSRLDQLKRGAQGCHHPLLAKALFHSRFVREMLRLKSVSCHGIPKKLTFT